MVATWWTIKNLKYKFEEKNVSVQVAMVKLLGTWWTGQRVPWSSRFSIVLHLLRLSCYPGHPGCQAIQQWIDNGGVENLIMQVLKKF